MTSLLQDNLAAELLAQHEAQLREITSHPAARQEDADMLEATAAAFAAGYDLGLAHGQRLADEDRVQEILHAHAARWTEAAVRTARAHHGPGWGTEIERQARGSAA